MIRIRPLTRPWLLVLVWVAPPPIAASEVEVFIPCQNPTAVTAGCAVYTQPYREDAAFVGRTSDQGALTDRFAGVEEVGRLVQRVYWVLPHDPDHWTLYKASHQAPPVLADLGSAPEMLRPIGRRVQARWDEVDEQPTVTTDPVPERGTVRIQTQGADGRPLAGRAVHLYPPDRFGGFGRESLMLSGKTDAHGVIEIRQFPGVAEWIVCFPGQGHTQTGPIVVTPGGESMITLHRPAPYAAISGRLSDQLRDQVDGEPRVVHLATDHAWQYRQAPIDAAGNFRLADVPVGSDYGLRVKYVATEWANVRGLYPEEERDGVVIEPPGKRAAEVAAMNQRLREQHAERSEWKPTLRGRVIDREGRGVEGATVYAVLSYSGGMRQMKSIASATTDANGRYEIIDAEGRSESIRLVAHAFGKPLAIEVGAALDPTLRRHFTIPSTDAPLPSLPEVLDQPDLVLPGTKQGGELRVTALSEGRPGSGVWVRLEPLAMDAMLVLNGGFGSVPEGLVDVLAPSQVTGEDGVAKFKILPPGRYRVTAAVARGERSLHAPRFPFDAVAHHWVSDNAAIVSGGSRGVAISLTSQPDLGVPIRVLQDDQQWLTDSRVTTGWAKATAPGRTSSSTNLDGQGYGTININRPGMWRGSISYVPPSFGLQSPGRSSWQPLLVAECRLASTALMKRTQPVVLRPRLRPPESGAIEVVLRDENSRPLQGVVVLDRSFSTQVCVPTNNDGRVRFDRVPPGRYTLRALGSAWSSEPITMDTRDDDLNHRWGVAEETVSLEAGDQATVRLTRSQAGYIRGRLAPPPANATSANIVLADFESSRRFQTRSLYFRETGDFLIGPVPPGKHTAILTTFRNSQPIATAQHTFKIAAAGIRREDFPVDMQPIDDSKHPDTPLVGTVVRADGSTPAYGARLEAHATHQSWRRRNARSAADGDFSVPATDLWHAYSSQPDLPPGTPTEPVLVAWLPGELGATITPLPSPPAEGEELRIVLPESAAIRGAVTVGGESPLGMPAAITVLAQHRGRGRLDEVLSVRTTANADGAYELCGLTPGEYEVQAAVDGIWLSSTTRVTVPAGQPWSHTLDIDFPPLGDAAEYRLIDAAGTPLANQSIRLAIPEFDGPLGSTLRSPEMSTDTGGVIHVEGLRAGEHQFTLNDSSARIKFDVPPLGSPMPIPVDIHVE